jgi:hypothetical protein
MKWSSIPNTNPPSGNGIHLCFGRHTGYGGYSDWMRGGRHIVVEEDKLGQNILETWVRLEDGTVSGRVTLNSTYGEDKYPFVEKKKSSGSVTQAVSGNMTTSTAASSKTTVPAGSKTTTTMTLGKYTRTTSIRRTATTDSPKTTNVPTSTHGSKTGRTSKPNTTSTTPYMSSTSHTSNSPLKPTISTEQRFSSGSIQISKPVSTGRSAPKITLRI